MQIGVLLKKKIWAIGNLTFLTLLLALVYNNCSRFKSQSLDLSQMNGNNSSLSLSSRKLTHFDLVSTQPGEQVFTVGVGFKKGDAPQFITTGLPHTQVIIKKRWNDGSVKHAIISGTVTLEGGTNVNSNATQRVEVFSSPIETNNASALTVADLQAGHPKASVQLGSLGSVALSSLLTAEPFRVFIRGPEMIEAHYRGVLAGANPLMAWFHVRLYRGEKYWVRAIVENGKIDDQLQSISYVPEVKIGGVTIFNNAGTPLTHPAHTRWMAEGWILPANQTPATPLDVKYDTEYLVRSQLVPNYWKRSSSTQVLNNLFQTYSPLNKGSLTANMGETGFQEQIGLLPLWDSLLITSRGDTRAMKAVIAHSSSLNSYPIIWRDQNTQDIPKPTLWPSWVIQGGVYSISSGALTWEVAHAPSEGYLAYLLTGDYWHYETMAFQTATIYLSKSSSENGVNKLLINQTRGTAWNLRTLAQFTALAPDESNGILAEYRSLLSNQLKYFKSLKDQPGVSQLGYLYEYNLAAYAPGVAAPWQQHFLIQALGHGSDLEPLTDMSVWKEVRDWSYKGIVGILGDGYNNNFCFTKAASYNIKISSATNTDPTTWFQNWNQVQAATFPNASPCFNNLEGSSGGDPAYASTGYWGNLLPAIAYAVDHQAPGATQAFARLSQAANWNDVAESGFDKIPNWGIVPRNYNKVALPPEDSPNPPVVTLPPPPMPPTPPDPNLKVGWSQIPNTKLSAVCAADPSPSHSTSSNCQALVLAWGNAVADTKRQRLVLFGGGHQDYDGNELYALDLNSKTMLRLNDPTPLPNGASGTSTYADGRPASRHTYGGITYSEHNDQMTLFGGSIAYSGGLLRDLWLLDFVTFYASPNAATPWKKITEDIAPGVNYGGVPFSAYDPTSKLVYLIDSGNGTYSFNTDTKQIQVLNNSSSFSDYHYTLVVDPINHYLYAFGYQNVKRMSLASNSNYKWTDILSNLGTSCSNIGSQASPGVAYDSKNKKIVGWNGNSSVYVIDPLNLSCTVKNFNGTAPTDPPSAGTFNRFAYFPVLNYFVLINKPDLDAYILKME